jgi:hypothetical protein
LDKIPERGSLVNTIYVYTGAKLSGTTKRMCSPTGTSTGHIHRRDERELPLANGWHFAKYTSTRKSYPVSLLMELLEDDATRFLKVEKSKLDAELKEHAEDGGRWTEISHRLQRGLEVERLSSR